MCGIHNTHRINNKFIKPFLLITSKNETVCCSTVIQNVPFATEPRHFFNNSNINEDFATKFEQKYVRCVRNE